MYGCIVQGIAPAMKVQRLLLPIAFLLIIALVVAFFWWRAVNSPMAVGDRALAAQEYMTALSAYRQAAAAEPENALPHLRAADILMLKRQYPEATAEVQAVLKRDPQNVDALRRVALLAALQGHYDDATTAWRQILQIYPADDDAAYRLGVDELRQGHVEQAQAALRSLDIPVRGADWRQRSRLLLAMIAVAQDSPDSNLANVQRDLDTILSGPDSDATAAARRLKQDLGLVTAGDPAQRLLQRAYALLQQRRTELFPLVAALCQRALDLNSGYGDAYAYLGYTQWQLGKIDEASVSLKRSVELAPDHALGHYFLGGLLRAQKQPQEAIDEFNRVLELDPANADAYIDLAGAAVQIPNYELAEIALVKAVELHPDNFAYRMALAHLYVDHTYRVDRALPQLEAALRLNPKSADAKDLQGWAQYLTINTAAAEKTLRDAIQLDPSSAASYYHLGVVLEQLGRTNEAKAAYLHAIDLDITGEYAQRAQIGLQKLGS